MSESAATSSSDLNPYAALSDALAAIVDTTARSVVAVRGRHRHAIASGVVWQPGVLVTAAHVFRRQPASAALVLPDGTAADATLAGIDAGTDIAVFRLPDGAATALPAAALGDASALRAGHLVVAVGRAADGATCASHGAVHRVAGPWQSWLGGQIDRQIRLDGGLWDGLSGAPVADAHGKVIGIGTAALSRSHGTVVPASTVSRVVEALLTKGQVGRAWLGIAAQTVALPAAAGAEGAAESVDGELREGLLVTGLADGGPAAQAGVMVGDIVVSAAGRAAGSLPALRGALADRIGERVPLALLRGGVPTTVELLVGQWPASRGRC